MDNSKITTDIFQATINDNLSKAKELIHKKYPHIPPQPVSRSHSLSDCLKIFIRDGFIDRYTGRKLFFPPALRIISLNLPDDFPYHPHWKMKNTHMAYWEFYPTIDHLLPIAKGGTNQLDNLVTTSQRSNSAKANWTLNELNWSLHQPGNIDEWDGMMKPSIIYLENHKTLLEDRLLKQWFNTAKTFDL